MSTKIEWARNADGSAGETWNPVRGCSRISTGCLNCYAERLAARGLPAHNSPTTGEPFAIRTPSGPRWTGKVELIPHMLDIPRRRRKPTTYFVNSMSDLFHEDLRWEQIDDVFDVMQECSRHTFQVLTKRSENLKLFGQYWASYHDGPLPKNVWAGVSVEDRARKDRIEHLRETPAFVRFLSLEPLLEDLGTLDLRGISWVIVGGESGPGARPMRPEWVRAIRSQCQASGVAFFFKQWGGPRKKVSGRMLDGKEWNEMPEHQERIECRS